VKADLPSWLVMLVFPGIALYLLAGGAGWHRALQAAIAVAIVVLSDGSRRWPRLLALGLVTVGALALLSTQASPVMPIAILLLASIARYLGTRWP
jgi:hypothetical protein